MLINQVTLRLFDVPETIINLLEENKMLPITDKTLPLIDIDEIKALQIPLLKSEWDGDKLLSYQTGAHEALIRREFEYNDKVIVENVYYSYDVKQILTRRPSGRLLRESIIDSFGDKTVRGEFIYDIKFPEALVAVHQYPNTTETQVIKPEEDGGEEITKIKVAAVKDADVIVSTNKLDGKGRVIETVNVDGTTRYEYSDDDEKGIRPLRMVTSMYNAMGSDPMERVTEHTYDENGYPATLKVYIDPENPIGQAEYRNVIEDGKFIKAFRIDENDNEGCFINLERYWNAINAEKV